MQYCISLRLWILSEFCSLQCSEMSGIEMKQLEVLQNSEFYAISIEGLIVQITTLLSIVIYYLKERLNLRNLILELLRIFNLTWWV